MQIYRNVQPLSCLEHRPELFGIVMAHVTQMIVNHGSIETKLGNCALHLAACFFWVADVQSCETSESIGALEIA